METSDWSEMIDFLQAIVVGGGGDCPEYAMSGMLLGIIKNTMCIVNVSDVELLGTIIEFIVQKL
jgi:branched-subunit amino acid ABC-type transport system permease component